ncbi:MAG: tRNA pseudouridine(38-40) synthase TruA [Treponema sp.]|jgi:tRNA pseudouridine38-40 synthase|nr:tRNA pseudouridine(38-40) synthase TruA [Treponema sp.]
MNEPAGRNIRLLIAYDGTDFSGWQRQDGGRRTVQGVLEAALEKMHGARPSLTGSGRTDAGVHAAGQVANFYTSLKNIPAERFVPALNGLLPRDLRILEARETRPDFHARFDAKARTYRYYLVCGRAALPQELRYALHIRRRPRIERLNEYGRLLLGERDCSLFASPRDSSISRSRHISRCLFFVRQDTLIFEITANAFLWKMVRSVLGTLLSFEERDLPPGTLSDALNRGSRRLAGPTLPGQGLFLWKIEYYRD